MTWEIAIVVGTGIIPIFLLWLSRIVDGSMATIKTLFFFGSLIYLGAVLFITMKIAEIYNSGVYQVVLTLFAVYTTVFTFIFTYFFVFMMIDMVKMWLRVKGR